MDNGSERLSAGPNGSQPSPRHGGVPAVHASQHAAVPAALKQSFNSVGMLKALRRRWLVALLVGVLCAAGAAAGAWYLIPPTKATAFTLLHMHSSSPAIVFPGAAGQGTPLEIYTRTQSALVRSQDVLIRVLNQFSKPGGPRLSVLDEQPNPVDWMASEIQVDFSTSPEIMRISMSGDRPEELAKIVDAVRVAYLAEIVNKDTEQRNKRLQVLSDLLLKYDGRLESKRKELKDLIDGGASPNAKAMAMREENDLEQLRAVRQDLLQTERNLRTARLELANILPAARDPRWVAVSVVFNVAPGIDLSGGLPWGGLPWGGVGQALLAQGPAAREQDTVPVPDAWVDEHLKSDPEGAQLLRHELRLTQFIDVNTQQAVNADSLDSVKNAKRDLAETRKQIAALRAKYRPVIAEQMRGKVAHDDQTKVTQLQSQIRLLESMEKALTVETTQLEKSVHLTSRKSFDYDSRKDEIASTEKLANRIRDDYEKLKVELGAPSRVVMLQDAKVTTPLDAQKQQMKKAAMAGAGALAAVLFVFGWFEFRKRRIDTPDEVLETLGIKVVGALPAMPGRRLLGRRSATGLWNNHMTESINTTRTMLLYAAAEDLRVVMVTSAMAGEGKTSLAGHLAVSLARAGKRTLLMDCDLRRSALHELFSLPKEPGISELLRDDTMPVQSAIQPTPVPGLALMAAGAWDPSVSEALAQDKLRGIMQPLREQYEFIIVDSAPILPVVDSLLVARHVDACLFSLLRDVSRLHSIHAADQRLAALGIRVLGAVVNGATGGIYGSYSPAYYASSYTRQ